MTRSKEILLNLYEEAKEKRVVLTQEEFAKAVGKSRAHLFKKMNEIPDSIIEKARKLIETKNVSQETNNDTIKVRQEEKDFIGDRVELTAALRAAIKILTLRNIEAEVKLSELEAKVTDGKTPILSFADVSLKIERMMQDETERILDEWRKK